jgi:spermidine synthase
MFADNFKSGHYSGPIQIDSKLAAHTLRVFMSNQSAKESDSPALRPLLPLLLVLFFGSGCAALIYEIVWFQMLQLVIGSSAVSLGVLLGTYMGGMCLGSVVLPRIVSGRRHPLRIYALLELGIGLIGVLILFGLPKVAWVYSAHVGSGFSAILLRGVFAAICLLPPTILMGATLPAIARWVESTPRGISWLGFFYGGNIAGALFGCLLAGFYLLRVHDSVVATFIAAAINGAVALAAFVLSASVRYETQVEPQPASATEGKISELPSVPPKFPSPVYVAIALSGLTAIGAEVVWTRLLSLTLGGTVYAFSIILAVFLFGLGIGSGVGSALVHRSLRPGMLLGWCQLLLTVAIAWTAYMLAKSLPYWPIDPSLTANAWVNFQLDLARCFWALLPPTLLWGASFPLALAAVAARGQDAGRLVGGIYAANTIGGILGGVGFSIIFIPRFGTQQSQRLLIGLAALAALLMFVAFAWKSWKAHLLAATLRGISICAALILFSFLLARGVSKIPGELVAYGRYMASRLGESQILYVGEGMNSSVAVSQLWDRDVRNFHVSGKIEASSDPQDMRLQRMLGHIPAMIHPQPRSVLIVGCGAGVTAGSFTVQPGVEKITLCELEPLVPKIASKYFSAENFNVVNDPRTTIIYDDARNYILTTHDKFDIITSDPIHPWVKGSATLYTKEYFELVRSHLNPGGIVTQWVPLYESDLSVVKSEIATFFEVFPNGTIWSNDQDGKGYDLVLLGQVGETKINLDEIKQRLAQPEFSAMAQSLQDVGFQSTFDVFATYAGQARDLTSWLKDAQINRDRNLRLQYLAGLHSNWYHNESIYADMSVYRKFPDGLFAGSDESKETLKIAMTKARSK